MQKIKITLVKYPFNMTVIAGYRVMQTCVDGSTLQGHLRFSLDRNDSFEKLYKRFSAHAKMLQDDNTYINSKMVANITRKTRRILLANKQRGAYSITF